MRPTASLLGRLTRLPLSSLSVIAGFVIGATPVNGFFYFQWPDNAYQCNTHRLTWANATAPFKAFVVPVYGQPFVYDIPDSAYSNGQGQYDLNAGTSYVVLMSDGTEFGAGGSSQIRRVQVSEQTDCLYTAQQNQTSLDFTFSLSGVAEQCERGFEMAWSGGREDGPYNFTVIPLDQSFRPYDVQLEQGVRSMSDWTLNMTAGARFTIMMNNKNGYGTGGVAGIYEVDNSTTPTESACIKQSIAPTGQWPVGLATNTLSMATLPVTERANPHSKLSGGAIAGVVIGAVAGLAMLALALWFLLRRKRRREAAARGIKGHEVDLADEPGMVRTRSVSASHVIEPYRTLDPFESGPTQSPHSSFHDLSSGDGATMASAGFAGLGAGLAGQRSRLSGEDTQPPGPGVAGPLPLKSSSSSSTPQSPLTSTSSRPSSHALKNDLLGSSSPSSPVAPAGPPHPGAMRIINHDDPAALPTLPSGARLEDRERRRRNPMAGPTFRRHEDAGRVPVTRREEEVVDLPPLYTDVPRDGPDYTPPEDNSPVSQRR